MQFTVVSGLLAVLFYLIGSVFQGINLAASKDTKKLVLVFGGLATMAHAVSAAGVIRTVEGYHFGVSEISTMVTLFISLLVLVSALRKPLQNLFLGLFPLAIIAIIASLALPSGYPPTMLSLGSAGHVLISILAYSIISIAAMQAGFLAYQNYRLKHGRPGGVISRFPPLQDMEHFLFELLWIGQIFLSLGIMAGILFVDDIWSREGIIHKTFFSIMAWAVFAVLLWGRHQLGWRGATAIRGTLSGFLLLIIGFYGSKIALEFVFT